ncbi:MAG: peptide ABC transporter permease, partial [Deltaproteobacteria bacterium]|nr:peptide ABC transporter permease [Deltaproteobacteria bacterium]
MGRFLSERGTGFLAALLAAALSCALAPPGRAASPRAENSSLVETFAAFGDRGPGSLGAARAAEFIRDGFEELFPGQTGVHRFSVPVVDYRPGASLAVPGKGVLAIHPLAGNAMTPQTTGDAGIAGPLVYVAGGGLSALDKKPLSGAVVLMDLASGKNWQRAAGMGASALVYLDPGDSPKSRFSDKFELTPIAFPRFVVPAKEARRFLGDYENAENGLVADRASVTCLGAWKEAEAKNVWCLVPGADPKLSGQLLVLEAFYDATAWVPGKSPGAEEALSIATLLWLAKDLAENPPARSVLLAATAGHSRSLAGMRELVFALHASGGDLEDLQNRLSQRAGHSDEMADALSGASFPLDLPRQREALVEEAVREQIKTQVDGIAQRLMRLRLGEATVESQERIDRLARERFMLRGLLWRSHYRELPEEHARVLNNLIPPAVELYIRMGEDARARLARLSTVLALRRAVEGQETAAVVSLHLSSHGDGMGAFNQ